MHHPDSGASFVAAICVFFPRAEDLVSSVTVLSEAFPGTLAWELSPEMGIGLRRRVNLSQV